jgi:hypothetical protein
MYECMQSTSNFVANTRARRPRYRS